MFFWAQKSLEVKNILFVIRTLETLSLNPSLTKQLSDDFVNFHDLPLLFLEQKTKNSWKSIPKFTLKLKLFTEKVK